MPNFIEKDVDFRRFNFKVRGIFETNRSSENDLELMINLLLERNRD